MNPEAAQLLFSLIEFLGMLAFGLSGLIAAANKRLDVVGAASVSFIAAFGGGTLRDLLLDRRPFFWMEYQGYVWMLLGVTVLAMFVMRGRRIDLTQRAIQIPDALGLGLFAALGTAYALQMGQSGLVASLLGVVTGVFGGVLRDVLCNEIPAVFSDHRPYALCAFAGAWTFVAADALSTPHWLALLAALSVTAGSRLLALRLDWRVPGWRDSGSSS
jgi:uncharacterized membrane protein YeiH